MDRYTKMGVTKLSTLPTDIASRMGPSIPPIKKDFYVSIHKNKPADFSQ